MSDGIGWHTPDNDGSSPVICRRIALPLFLWPHFNGAYGELMNPDNWTKIGGMTPDDVVSAFIDAYDNLVEGCS